jgi:hypothetical protein
LEVNEDVHVVPNDELLDCVGHESHSKANETFVNEVNGLIRTFIGH